jgi:hypothetical protein
MIDLDEQSLPAFMHTLISEMNVNGRIEDRRDLAATIDAMISQK